MKQKLMVMGTALAGFLGLGAMSAFAAAPTPDAGVVTATSDLITGLQGAGISGLTTLLPIAAVLVVTAALVFWVLSHFRAIARI